MPTVASADIVNQALMMIGANQPLVTGAWPNFAETGGGGTAGKAANKLYGPCVATVGQRFEWDFARNTVELELSGNTAPFPWALEYLYPDSAIQIWQLFPSDEDDPFDPLPTNFVTANALVSTVQKRVIHTNLADALAVVNNDPAEDTWTPGFREAVVRLLSSELAMAIAGKPDTAQTQLESAAAFEGSAETRRN